MKKIILITIILITNLTYSQKENYHKKGQFYAYWGWNRAWYSSSDIHFKGENYSFTINNVKANDNPIPFNYNDYLNPGRLTIPQNNYKIGFFIKDNLAINLGVDHMKYVMLQNQTVPTNGYINVPGFENRIVEGYSYLSEDFITLEHTDGLNYINSEIEYYYPIYKKSFVKFDTYGGVGVGILVPKTNAKLLGFDRNDNFYLSGWGTNIKLGLELLLWDHFFIRTELKEGYINMSNVVTTNSSNGNNKATQDFLFLEWNTFLFGYCWNF